MTKLPRLLLALTPVAAHAIDGADLLRKVDRNLEPESYEMYRKLIKGYMLRHKVKPGITGLAQINGRGLLSWGETLEWDLRYVRTRSVWSDLKIILITLKYIITRRGAF